MTNLPNGLQREISIVIPAYNEEARIVDSLRQIIAYLSEHFDVFDVLVIDDGSHDGTARVVKEIGHPAVRCLVNATNFGKGYSVRRGVLAAKYDPILFSDADLSTPIEETASLLCELNAGHDIAIGSRRGPTNQEVKRSPLRKLVGWSFATFVRLTMMGGFRDTQCGFKLFRRAAVRSIFPYQRINGWGFDVEILFIARLRKLRISEVPVRWFQSEGTRLQWFTPLMLIVELLRIRRNSLLGRYQVDSSSKK